MPHTNVQDAVALVSIVLIVVVLVQWPVLITYFTGWVLIVLALYLVAYLADLTNPALDATMFTLALIIPLQFAVFLVIDLVTHRSPLQHNTVGIIGGNLLVLALIHLLPILILWFLADLPTVGPNVIVVFIVMITYIIGVRSLTHHGPATRYLLPEKWYSYVLIFSFTVISILLTEYIASEDQVK